MASGGKRRQVAARDGKWWQVTAKVARGSKWSQEVASGGKWWQVVASGGKRCGRGGQEEIVYIGKRGEISGPKKGGS